MKRTLSFLAALLLLASLYACGEVEPPEPETFIYTTTTVTEPPTTIEPQSTKGVFENPIQAIGNSGEWAEDFPILKEPEDNYFEVVHRFGEMCERGVLWDSYEYKPNVYVMFYDLDGDFTPELLVSLAIAVRGQWQVYTMYNGKARWIGSFWEGELYSHSKGGLYIGREAHDIERWSRLTKKGNQLVEKELFTRSLVVEEPFVPSDGVLLQFWFLGELSH